MAAKGNATSERPPRRAGSLVIPAADRRGSSPVKITDAALAQMALVRRRQHPRSDQSLGLILDSAGQVGLVLDVPDAGDRLFSSDGETVLFIAQAVESKMRDRLIDFEGEGTAGHFTVTHLPPSPR